MAERAGATICDARQTPAMVWRDTRPESAAWAGALLLRAQAVMDRAGGAPAKRRTLRRRTEASRASLSWPAKRRPLFAQILSLKSNDASKNAGQRLDAWMMNLRRAWSRSPDASCGLRAPNALRLIRQAVPRFPVPHRLTLCCKSLPCATACQRSRPSRIRAMKQGS